MSLEDLRRMGLLKSDADRDVAPPSLHLPTVLATAGLAIGGCAAMWFGDGGVWLVVGLLAFVTGLFGFIAVNLRGVG